MTTPARTVIVPAAGTGMRSLPATKTVSKELLFVADTPDIEIIAEEAVAAGAQRLAIATVLSKGGVLGHFDPCPDLEQTLAERGEDKIATKVRRATEVICVESAVQDRPLGSGYAVLAAEPLFEDDEDSVATMLPDDLVLLVGVMDRMTEVREYSDGSVLCALEIPHREVYNYGVFDIEDAAPAGFGEPGTNAADADAWDDVKRVKGMVEKPDPVDAPSNFVTVGRYLLDRAIFDALYHISRGKSGEYQLTDAIELLIQEGHPVHVVVHKGFRYDLGNPGGFIRVRVDFGLRHPDYGEGSRDYMQQRLAQDEQA